MPLVVTAAACLALAGAALDRVEGAEVRVASSAPAAARGALPRHCAVRGTVSASIGFELRVPQDWNGKLLMQGCNALCGYHATGECDDALARGYATLTTDTGHTGTPIDTAWGAADVAARENYAWRAVHLVALTGKALVARLAGARPTHTYHRGCSNGGRQGLLEAERHPDTFDGVIAGAPLVPGEGLLNLIWAARAVVDDAGRPVLLPEDLPVLHEYVLRECGGRNGVVAHPDRCAIDPLAPDFGRGTAAATWPAAKREAVRRVYSGPTRRDGTRLTAGGPAPGSELAWTTFVAPPGERSLFATLAANYLRDLVYPPGTPAPTLEAFDFERDVPAVLASAADGRASGDLRAFVARGGRAIVWHGWADESVVPWNSISYVAAVKRRLGERMARRGVRLYLLPGVAHCGAPPAAERVDRLDALDAWVTRGRAPRD